MINFGEAMKLFLSVLGVGWLAVFMGMVTVGDGAAVARRLLDIPAITTLEHDVKQHKLLNHDLLVCLQNGRFQNTTDAIKTFFSHHYVYSHHFIDYLNKVLNKISIASIREPIEENIEEENGHYQENDLKIMEQHNINRKWFQNIPHKELSKRFLEAVGVDSKHLRNLDATSQEAQNHAGFLFTQYMLNMYDKSNACEAVAVIGFAIEETVSKLYSFVYDTLKYHTTLDASDYVFFPLHILIDDGHADLLKLSFKHYVVTKPEMCENAARIVHEVLDRRSRMFDMVKAEIEQNQGSKCKLDGKQPAKNTLNIAQVRSDAAVKVKEAW